MHGSIQHVSTKRAVRSALASDNDGQVVLKDESWTNEETTVSMTSLLSL